MGQTLGSNDALPVEHLSTVLKATLRPALVLRHNPEGLTIVGGNEAWVGLCGIAMGDLMRRSPSVCLSESLIAEVQATLTGERPQSPSHVQPSPEHRVGDTRVTATIAAFEPQAQQRFVLLTADPTGQDQSDVPFSAMLEAFQSGVLLVEAGGRVSYANKAMTSLTGWRVEEVTNADVRSLMSETSAAELSGQFAQVSDQPLTTALELTHRQHLGVAVEATTTLLPGSTQQFMLSLRDLTSQQQHEETLAGLSAIDALTGLANRQAVVDRMAAIAAATEARELTVAFLDVDNFKTVNDALGHDQGDVVLRTIAERLEHTLDDRFLVARFGGDEFVVASGLDPGAGHAELCYLLGQVFADPISLDGNQFKITASIGIASTTDRSQMGPGAVLKHADMAMYEAKRTGKDRFAVYDESLETQASARLQIESDLRRAIDQGEFVLHYQPIIDVMSGRPAGAEALVRWQHPEHGMIPPDQFIPIAEDTGLIIPLGAWVLETAVAQAAEWNKQRLTRRALGISVNLSSLQLSDPDLENCVHAALSRYGFDPARLTLEVTESALMTDGDETLEILARLRDVGIRIAIDDFGTGYSSLAYMKRLPAKALKVDKAFIDGLGTKREDTALVTGIIGLASALDFEIVAEGVESALQLKELRRLGCEYSQGYYHSRPLPAAEFEAWINTSDPRPEPRTANLPMVPETAIVTPPSPALAPPRPFVSETASANGHEPVFFDQDQTG